MSTAADQTPRSETTTAGSDFERAADCYAAPLLVEGRPRFGVSLPTSGPFASAEAVMSVAKLAAREGFDDLWVNDHYTWSRGDMKRSPSGAIEAIADQSPNYLESLSSLAIVGAQVPDIGIAVHAITLPARDIRLFVKQITTIREFLGSRLRIAPAIGGLANLKVMGIPRAERGRRLDEALEAMTTILGSDHPVDFQGDYTQFRQGSFYPRPRDIGLWITGDSKAAISRVARYGTGWFSSPAHLDRFSNLFAHMSGLFEATGRSIDEIERATDLFICIGDTEANAVRMSESSLIERYGSLELGRQRAAIGTVEAVGERLKERLDMGFTYLELRYICPDEGSLLDMISCTARDILPRLRGTSAAK